jgi:uncharacterized membrane protein
VADPGAAKGDRETGRLESFSDGVMAVIITIMAFELKAPVGGSFADLRPRLAALLVYVLSFAFIGIYWNNHHHLLRTSRHLTAGVMWANLLFLFCLSLIPVITEWVGDDWRHAAPAATYAIVALASGGAYSLLQLAIIRADGPDSAVAKAIGRAVKERLSVASYTVALGLAFVSPLISYAMFAFVAIMWFVPDRRLASP